MIGTTISHYKVLEKLGEVPNFRRVSSTSHGEFEHPDEGGSGQL